MRRLSRNVVPPPRRARSSALVVVDSGVLKNAAWDRLGRARKRLTKATADLHRHEQEDEPAYRRWMFASRPALLSEIRDLLAQCEGKSALIADVEARARREGRPPAVVWQLYKGQLSSVGSWSAEEAEDDDVSEDNDEEKEAADQIIDEFLEDAGIDPLSPEAEMMRDLGHAFFRPPAIAEPAGEAKEIYRRLVQRLHPDRGGVWSLAREALWHEVQRAWKARDADWLARLESELEIAAETLTASSELGRLSAALRQIEAARRDTERKLRYYRTTPAWRFTLETRKPGDLETLTSTLQEERRELQTHLANLDAVFTRWEKPLGQARAKQKSAAKMLAPGKAARRINAGRTRLETGQNREA